MSTYYLLINTTLKEFLCSGCVGNGLHQYGYKKGNVSKLVFSLVEQKWFGNELEKQYQITDDVESMEGHWVGGCEIRLVSEHDDMYWQAKCINDAENKIQDYGFMNVTPPAVMDYNDYCNDEDKIKLDICSNHRDKSSVYWREKLK